MGGWACARALLAALACVNPARAEAPAPMPLHAEADPIDALSRCAALYALLSAWSDVRDELGPFEPKSEEGLSFFVYATMEMVQRDGGLDDETARVTALERIGKMQKLYYEIMTETRAATGRPFGPGDRIHHDLQQCTRWYDD